MYKSSVFHHRKVRLLAAMAAGLTLSFSTAVQADEAVEEEVIAEVVVYGIKNSLLDAISIKRSNVGVMDAISAEDFGKFPDGNLAESLARLSGVAIDRSNVEGSEIAVRGFGPEFNLVTLNGRQMPTVAGQYGGGRSFNFGDIASPGVSAVEVFKSSNSTLPSGGIGTTVNMVTTKPLNIEGTKQSYSLNLVEDSTSVAGGQPLETSMLFATNRDRWGFSLSASYQDRTNREEGTRESNWITPEDLQNSEGYLRVDSSTAGYVNNNTRADGYTFYQEPSAYLIKDNDRQRTNAQATFQYLVTDALTATVDYTMSGVEFASEGTLFGSWLGGWDTASATISENGAYTDVVVGNRAYDHTVTWGDSETQNKSWGLNLAWDVSDKLQLSVDAHRSTAELSGNIFDNELGLTTDSRATITTINGGTSNINTFSYDTTFGPENMMASSLFMRDGYQENEITQMQLKGTWFTYFEGPLKSVDFGISSAESEFTRQSRESNFGATTPNVADYDDALFVRTDLGNFMNSFNPNLGTNYYFEVDAASAMNAFAAVNGALADPSDGTVCCEFGGLDSNERVREELDSAYLQFNFETAIAGRPLNIVAGLRYEDAKTVSSSYYPAPTSIRWDMILGLVGIAGEPVDSSRSGDSSIVLPNLAMALQLTDNQVLRFSAGKSMARANLNDLRAELDVGSQDFFNLTATGGNPGLQPLESTNFDLSYENYYAEGSYFAVNYFRKEIDNFIGSRTVNNQPINDLRNPAQSANGIYAQQCVQAWADAGRPATGFPGEGGTGDCVSQQALWAQDWMNDQHHMGWVALAMARGIDVSAGFPYGACDSDGWWRCEPGYLDASATDPLAEFDITQPFNINDGTVSGFEVTLQHLFEGTPFGMQVNYTKVTGGNVEPDTYTIGDQFILSGFGDSGNLSGFFENEKHTFRLALNYRAETAQGFANYEQPVFVDERHQIDASYQYRHNESITMFFDAQNITDESTRLWVRHPEMLFLSQDHGPIYKFGVRANF